MKTIIALAAAAAALATASPAFANDHARGHWEWRNQPAPGLRIGTPSRARVWVKDDETRIAGCDCFMMKMDAAACMRAMPGNRQAQPAG